MSLNEFVILISILLIILDFFLVTDVTTHIAWLLIACLISFNIEMHFLYHILLVVLIWIILIAFHYMIWKKIMIVFVNKYISQDKIVVGINNLIGMSGYTKKIDNHLMAEVNGDLYEIINFNELNENIKFCVEAIQDGKLIIKINNT